MTQEGPTQETQDDSYLNGSFEDDPSAGAETPWGRLLPLQSSLPQLPIYCSMDKVVIGRSSTCGLKLPEDLPFCSNKHCEIWREHKTDNVYTIWLKDLSRNGTFVDGRAVGKGQKRTLHHNSVIVLANHPESPQFTLHLSDPPGIKEDPIWEQYKREEKLGDGAGGDVWAATDRVTGQQVAVKEISKSKLYSLSGSESRKYYSRTDGLSTSSEAEEVRLMKMAKHPNVVQVISMNETEHKLYIVLELAAGGELFDYIVDNKDPPKHLSESQARYIFIQVFRGVQYLHSRKIVHRDLKPENILLSDSGPDPIVKITDFGLAKMIGPELYRQTMCGTPTYQAPEVLNPHGASRMYSYPADMWSLGVILYIALCGYPPFAEDVSWHGLPMFDAVQSGKWRFEKDDAWASTSKQVRQLISGLLKTNPSDRISIEQALDHPWIKKGEAELARVNRVLGNTASNLNVPEASSPPTDDRTKRRRIDIVKPTVSDC